MDFYIVNSLFLLKYLKLNIKFKLFKSNIEIKLIRFHSKRQYKII